MKQQYFFILANLIAAISFNTLAQQPAFLTQEIRVEQLSSGLYLLYGNGPNSNVGLSIGEDGAFVIDDQLKPMTDKLLSAIREITDAPVRFVVNTHVHRDHIGANGRFREAGAVIISHDNVYRRLSDDRDVPANDLPVLTFSDTTTLSLNGDTIHVFWPGPAHTDGDSVIWFQKANVMFVGDLFFNHRFPFIDKVNGGSLDGLISNAEKLISMIDDKTILVPGHHKPGRKKDIILFRDMLLRTSGEIKNLIAGGKTIEDVMRAKPFSDLYDSWQTRFMTAERYIQILYDQLTIKNTAENNK